MEQVALDQLGPAARGVFAVGRNFAYAIDAAGLCATVLRDRPDRDDAEALTAIWTHELAMPPHHSLFDAGGLAAVAPAAFVAVQQFLAANAAQLAHAVRAQALVSPGGTAGAAIAGFYRVYPPPYPVRVHVDRAAALADLGGDGLAAVLAAIDDAIAAGDVVARVGRWLAAAALAQASLPRAAAALAMSERSLQRSLAAHRTTFAAERARAQLRRAQELLLTTDTKLEAIADAIGCASRSSLTALFRRATGLSPAAWREAHRTPNTR